ncbi:hypothetical protein ACLB2K_040513 [Fragaria x ananassa]
MNKIVGVLGEDNRWRTGYVNVGCVFVDYFRQLFTIGGSDMSRGIFGEVAGRVTVEQGVTLNKPFSRGEIEAALKDMGPTKSPGPDSMPPLFYQKYWSVVGDAVISRCLEFFNGNSTIKDLNHTLIALIPKIPAPKKVTEFRPISLCNVIYKLILKAFANRLKLAVSFTVCGERALGQKISVEKSAVSFSPRTTRVVKESCSTALDMKIVPCHERYMGLPIVTERNKKKGGKGIHWRKWDALCVSKGEGRLIQDEESLVGRMLKAKYYPSSSFLEAEIGRNPSSIWKAVMWGKQLLTIGLRWRVSNGTNIRVFQEPWVLGIPEFKIEWKNGCDWNMRVNELISVSVLWDMHKLEQVATTEEVEAVLSIPIVRSTCPAQVECDCLEAVRLVNDVGECFAEEGILVDQVKALLVVIGSSKLSHVSKTANGAANVVAKYVARLDG